MNNTLEVETNSPIEFLNKTICIQNSENEEIAARV